MDASEILNRSQAAWVIKDCWKSILQEAYELAFPGLSPYVTDRKKPRIQNKMFDSTAVYSVLSLANRFYNEITPPSGQMANLEVGPLLEMKIGKEQAAQVNKELSKQNDIIEMILQSSSAITALWSGWLDYVVAAMGCILILEDTKNDLEPFIFESVSQADIAIEEGVGGKISAVSRRRFDLEVRKIKSIWPEAIIPDAVKGDPKNNPKINIIEYCYQDENGWVYKVIHANDNNPSVLVERNYNTCPFIIWRGARMSGSIYGISHVLMALPDIRTANKTKEMILKNAAIALAGMYLAADDGVLNVDNIQITNGGIIPVARTGGSMGASIAPLETGRNFDIGSLVLEDLRSAIKKGLKDNQLPPLAGKVRSPTEIIERQKELSQDFGGDIPRVLAELVVEIYRRIIDIGSRRGVLMPMKIDQLALKVTVKTPLAKGNDAQDVEKFIQWWQILVTVLGPQMAMAVVKMPKIIPWLSAKVGISSDLYNTEEENSALQEQVAQLVAAQSAQQTQPSIPQQA